MRLPRSVITRELESENEGEKVAADLKRVEAELAARPRSSTSAQRAICLQLRKMCACKEEYLESMVEI